jgi:acyl-CoA synthetase (NDP forming)
MRYFDRAQLDRVFNARSIAVVGATKANNYSWLRRFHAFKGKLYSVHIEPSSIREIEALGIANYRSILDVPESVDYVVVITPRRTAVGIFSECIKAKVGAVSFFTGGFAEHDAQGRELQQTLASLSRESGVPLIGPNCTGVNNPELGLVSSATLSAGPSGPVGFLGQSGTHTGYFGKALLDWHGIHLAKAVGFGNAAVLDAADWIEYIGEDPRVKVVAAYVEGIGERSAGDHQRFSDALRRVTASKPVVIWKGGQTEDGARTTEMHTASKRVTAAEWDSLLEQAGAIGVDGMEPLVDTVAALVKLPQPKGPRAAIIVVTGGQSVAVTDVFARNGLSVPRISEKSIAELETFCDTIGGSCLNPLDAAYMLESPEMLERELRILDEDANTDFVAMDLFANIMPVARLTSGLGLHDRKSGRPGSGGASFLDVLAAHQARSRKPFFVIVTAAYEEKEALQVREAVRQRGVLAFSSAERAAAAYRRALEYRIGPSAPA